MDIKFLPTGSYSALVDALFEMNYLRHPDLPAVAVQQVQLTALYMLGEINQQHLSGTTEGEALSSLLNGCINSVDRTGEFESPISVVLLLLKNPSSTPLFKLLLKTLVNCLAIDRSEALVNSIFTITNTPSMMVTLACRAAESYILGDQEHVKKGAQKLVLSNYAAAGFLLTKLQPKE